jgi:hypothetical protein
MVNKRKTPFSESEIKKRFKKIWESNIGMFEKIRIIVGKKPVYHSVGRTLPYYSVIHELLSRHAGGIKKLKGKKVLHLAASTGIYAKYLQSLGINAIPLDKSQILKISEAKNIVLADAKKLPFKENSIDFFISDHFLLSKYLFLEHSYSGLNKSRGSKKVFFELSKIMKKNGIGIIYSYSSSELNKTASFIKSLGFEIIEQKELKSNTNKDRNTNYVVFRKK